MTLDAPNALHKPTGREAAGCRSCGHIFPEAEAMGACSSCGAEEWDRFVYPRLGVIARRADGSFAVINDDSLIDHSPPGTLGATGSTG